MINCCSILNQSQPDTCQASIFESRFKTKKETRLVCDPKSMTLRLLVGKMINKPNMLISLLTSKMTSPEIVIDNQVLLVPNKYFVHCLNTLRLHYNAVLYNMVSAWLPNICPVYTVCENVSRRWRYNASCENRTPCVFPSQVWHQLIFPEAVSTGHSKNNAYVIGDHV